MSKELAFDKKNEQDYDKNTQLITDALAKISANPKLKTTKQEIVNLTGLSRNTVSNRASQEHPQIINSILKEIKDRRDKSKQKSKEEKANQALKLTN
jgi:flagellar motor component MotA